MVGSITLGDVMPVEGIVFVVVVTFVLRPTFSILYIYLYVTSLDMFENGNTLPSKLITLSLNE